MLIVVIVFVTIVHLLFDPLRLGSKSRQVGGLPNDQAKSDNKTTAKKLPICKIWVKVDQNYPGPKISGKYGFGIIENAKKGKCQFATDYSNTGCPGCPGCLYMEGVVSRSAYPCDCQFHKTK